LKYLIALELLTNIEWKSHISWMEKGSLIFFSSKYFISLIYLPEESDVSELSFIGNLLSLRDREGTFELLKDPELEQLVKTRSHN
jgi:hypothetical protein